MAAGDSPAAGRRRPTRLLLAVAAISGAASSGCGTGPSAATSPADSAYLSEVHDAAPDIATLRSDTQLIRLGHAVCDGFSAGASYVQLADRLALLQGSHFLPSQDLGAVITSAVDNFCPKYRGQTS